MAALKANLNFQKQNENQGLKTEGKMNEIKSLVIMNPSFNA